MTGKGRTMAADQVKLLIREGEGLTVEFKERYTPRMGEDIVAFANAKGGTLLLGVRDDGIMVVERLTNDLKGRINSLAQNCKPSISMNLAQVGELVAIVVPEGTETPYSCGSGYCRRHDGNTQKMSHNELRIMFAENKPLPFEEKTVKGFTFDDISKGQIPVADAGTEGQVDRRAAARGDVAVLVEGTDALARGLAAEPVGLVDEDDAPAGVAGGQGSRYPGQWRNPDLTCSPGLSEYTGSRSRPGQWRTGRGRGKRADRPYRRML